MSSLWAWAAHDLRFYREQRGLSGQAVTKILHCAQESERTNVPLRVVADETGANEGLDGPFKIVRVPERDVAFVEASGGGRLIMGLSEVQGFGVRFDRIGADALSREASRGLIARYVEALTWVAQLGARAVVQLRVRPATVLRLRSWMAHHAIRWRV